MSGTAPRNAFAAMEEYGLLHSYHTKTALPDNRLVRLLIGCHIIPIIQRRLYPVGSYKKIHSYWFREVVAIALKKIHFSWLFPSLYNSHIQADLMDKKVANYLKKHIHEVDAVYGYENNSYYTFQVAKKYGIKCIYELPIGYWKAKEVILSKQANLYPEWDSTMQYYEIPNVCLKKDKELELADMIIVPSNFVKDSLAYYSGQLAPIHVVQYGGPNNTALPHPINNDGKIKILFLGGLSQRKGLADVFEVYEKLDKEKFQLTVVGSGNIEGCRPLKENLKKVCYIPSLSNCEVLKLMSTMDVFFFPSHFEGFALVILEAMSQGLPVITTDITSGPIVHGKDGWIVKQNDIDGMVNLFNHLELNRTQITECSKNAIITAQNHSWKKYQETLVKTIQSS